MKPYYVVNEENSGIFLRVFEEGKWQTKLLEEVSEKNRNEWLSELNEEALIRTVNRLCEILKGNKK